MAKQKEDFYIAAQVKHTELDFFLLTCFAGYCRQHL